MEGGPKSLKAGLKFEDEGKDGEGTEEPGQTDWPTITNTHGTRPFICRVFILWHVISLN